jgi:hypothetical protein
MKRLLPAWNLLVLANFVYRLATIILIFQWNIDHEICCLFSDELSDGVSQAGGNGLRGI